MRMKPNRNQVTWGITIFLTAAAILVLFYFLFRGSAVSSGIHTLNRSLAGILIGIILTMILAPIGDWIENRWFRPYYVNKGIDLSKPEYTRYFRRTRKWSVFLTELILILVLILLALLIIPSTIHSVIQIINNITGYIRNLTRTINQYLEHIGAVRNADGKVLFESDNLQNLLENISGQITTYVNKTIIPNMDKIVKQVSDSVVQIVKSAVDLLVGIIVSVYLLYSREHMSGQFKKFAYGVFREDVANVMVSECRFIWKTFAGFFSGKIVDSIIIGILCLIGLSVLRTPYAGLLSTVVGVTNIIPFFGPYIGGIFGFLLLILIDPWQALYFAVFVICLQQFDGNILGPKILGNSTGLTSFWVIFAIMLFGAMFGMVGWVIGVPIFAVLYSWIRRAVNYRLSRKNMPTQAEVYSGIGAVRNGVMVSAADVPVGGDNHFAGLFHNRNGVHSDRKDTMDTEHPDPNDTVDEVHQNREKERAAH